MVTKCTDIVSQNAKCWIKEGITYNSTDQEEWQKACLKWTVPCMESGLDQEAAKNVQEVTELVPVRSDLDLIKC